MKSVPFTQKFVHARLTTGVTLSAVVAGGATVSTGPVTLTEQMLYTEASFTLGTNFQNITSFTFTFANPAIQFQIDDLLLANAIAPSDTTPPTISSVSVPSNATYITGNNLDFTVNFNENVTVNTGGGTPYLTLTLDTGGTVNASYVSGTGTSALLFRYTVASGNLDANGVTLGSLSLNGGTLQDAAGNNATLTLNSVGSTAGVLIDAVAPTLNPTGSTPADDATNIAVNTSPALVFSENIAFGTGLITLYNVTTSSVVETFNVASAQGTGNGQVSISGNTLTINPTNALAEGTQYAIQIAAGAIRDSAGNNLSAISDNASYNFTTVTPPGITLSKTSANVTEGGATDTYTVVLNAAPTADVTINLSNANGQVAVASSWLTFTTANWATPQTVTLTAANDTVGEGKHSGVIRHAVSSTDSGYNNIAVSNVQVAISDNDLPASDPTFISQSAIEQKQKNLKRSSASPERKK